MLDYIKKSQSESGGGKLEIEKKNKMFFLEFGYLHVLCIEINR